MAASSGKTIALVLLVVALALFVFSWRGSPLILAPFGVFSSITHLVRVPDWDRFHFGPDWMRFSSLSILSFAFFVIWILVIIWVYRDAERRGMNGVLWALLVFIGNLVGLLIYLILRSDSARGAPVERAIRTCPKCQKSVSPAFVYCPHCGASMQNDCPSCGKKVEEEWIVCPHCGEKLTKGE